MTEPLPEYELSESDVQHEIAERHREAGWFVVVTSQDRATRGQLAGLPDLICHKRGRTRYIEVKKAGGRIRDSQIDFMDEILPLCDGVHLEYYLAWNPEMVEA